MGLTERDQINGLKRVSVKWVKKKVPVTWVKKKVPVKWVDQKWTNAMYSKKSEGA